MQNGPESAILTTTSSRMTTSQDYTPITVAALQCAPALGKVEQNIEEIAHLSEGVKCDLLVIPELASTGYFYLEKEELMEHAEDPGSGPFCSWMRDHAAGHGRVVVGGFAEKQGNRLYNSALVALPDGTAHVYRKTHLFYKERSIFQPGDSGFFVVEWGGVRYGTMICYDWRFPESARTLALRGADIIAHPSNLVAAKRLWGPTMQTRSFENKVIAVTANRFGEETRGDEHLLFSGESQITDMNGAVLALAGPTENTVITAQVVPEKTRDKSFNPLDHLFHDRRPEMYE